MKKCKRCQTYKDRGLFYRENSRPDGLRPICKECDKERRRIDALKVKVNEAMQSIELGLIKGFTVENGSVKEIPFDSFTIESRADIERALSLRCEIVLSNGITITKPEAKQLGDIDFKVLFMADVYY